MANPQHLTAIKKGAIAWNQWRQEHEIQPDLRQASFRDMNLAGINLEAADLREVNLYKANLSKAKLTAANLNSADLRQANASRSRFISRYTHLCRSAKGKPLQSESSRCRFTRCFST